MNAVIFIALVAFRHRHLTRHIAIKNCEAIIILFYHFIYFIYFFFLFLERKYGDF